MNKTHCRMDSNHVGSGSLQVVKYIKLRATLCLGKDRNRLSHVFGIPAYSVLVGNKNLPSPAIKLLGKYTDSARSPISRVGPAPSI